ncbi:hypothetical protein C8J56DRAFT_880757 [Mycena floridula]|nr:hypothetical protein C8J56DRAFT_880757 [Mycena floridula]
MYGASIGTGAWTFKTGEWIKVMEQVKVGNHDASITISINGVQKIKVDNLVLPGKIRGAMWILPLIFLLKMELQSFNFCSPADKGSSSPRGKDDMKNSNAKLHGIFIVRWPESSQVWLSLIAPIDVQDWVVAR